ncbi:YncE family protein [Subtercola sp. YIM 133946]|uniref:YncE family protein n=1 Tax=Subtercola sp. YIM 133946 TaxID=3118909 RepID=UPI002F94ECF4
MSATTVVLAICLIGTASASASTPTDAHALHGVSHFDLPLSDTGGARGVTIDSRRHQLYVADHDKLLAVDERTGATTVFADDVGGNLDEVAVDSVYDEVFAAQYDEYGHFWVLVFAGAAHSKIATIPVPGGAKALAVDEQTHTVVAVGSAAGAGSATFIDEEANVVENSVGVGSDPSAVDIDLLAGRVFVANSTSNSVSVIDETDRTVAAVINVGEQPAGVAVDRSSGHVFVTLWRGSAVDVIASTRNPTSGAVTYSTIETLSIPNGPWGVAVDSNTHAVYVATEGAHTATLLDGLTNELGETVGPIDGQPWRVAVDDALHVAFVTGRNSSTIALISPAPELAPRHGCTFCL